MPKTAQALVDEYKAIYAAADRENRDLTASEREQVVRLIERAEEQHEVETKINSLGRKMGSTTPFASSDPNASVAGGPGDVFIASSGYKAIQRADQRPQRWSSGPVEVPLQMKGTLLETGSGGPGGGLVPPQYDAGIVSKLFEPLGVRDLFGTSQTTGSQLRYVVEGTATSGAAGVAEAGVKPESTLAYSEVVEPVKKIATLLPVSDEMLEDAPSIQTYLNSRLGLFVSIEEERQLLRGNGTNELIGLFNRAGNQAINTYTRLAADDNLVALARVIANTAGSANVMPDAIVMHPTNWLTTRLLRAGTAGDYFGGPPMSSGNGLFGQSVWDLPVVLSTVVGAGTALVGNFGQAGHVWRRGGPTTEASNSHSDWFARDITAIRCETRLALGVYRPAAFTAIAGLQ